MDRPAAGQPVVYLWPNAALIFLSDIVTTTHRHHAFEIYLGLDHPFEMDLGQGFEPFQGLLVGSGVPHRFSAGNGRCALILVPPGHALAAALSQCLPVSGPHWSLPSDLLTDSLPMLCQLLDPLQPCAEAARVVRDFLTGLAKKTGLCPGSVNSPRPDPRIKTACTHIRNTHTAPLRLPDLARTVHLSDSRFRHLFKQETGLTLRQYILTVRTLEAVKRVVNGASKTRAAHGAGFSDAAHLSRTFRAMYGITLSQLYNRATRETVRYCPEPF